MQRTPMSPEGKPPLQPPRPSLSGPSPGSPLSPNDPPPPFTSEGTPFTPSQPGNEFEDAPPSYEDAVGANVAPIQGPRGDYSVPPSGNEDSRFGDVKRR